MADAESIEVVISPDSNPNDKYRASLDDSHEACCSVLESTTYLELLLYCSQGTREHYLHGKRYATEERDEYRAKDHARFSMVCKKWQVLFDSPCPQLYCALMSFFPMPELYSAEMSFPPCPQHYSAEISFRRSGIRGCKMG